MVGLAQGDNSPRGDRVAEIACMNGGFWSAALVSGTGGIWSAQGGLRGHAGQGVDAAGAGKTEKGASSEYILPVSGVPPSYREDRD